MAGLVIAREAGATVTDSNGEQYDPVGDLDARRELVASNGPVHNDLLAHLQQSDDLCKL
jgi:myo-inositol-1(or 4)-monophosphatase